jgi:FkbM family methyltransferase
MSEPRLSYGQNFEDILLDRVFAGRPTGFFVDVGAGDPIRYSTTYKLHLRGWRGLNIEPSPDLAATLARVRPDDVTLCIALGDAAAEATLHRCATRDLSTLDPATAADLRQAGHQVDEIVVAVRTLDDVLREHGRGRDVALLKIDVEGWERRVLEGADLGRHRPQLIVIEATAPGTREPTHAAWEPGLLAAGFTFAWFDGLNRFYVRNEDRGLLEHFRVPVGLFDGFSPYELFARSAALTEAQAGWRRAEDEWAKCHGRAEALASELLDARARLVELESRRRGGWPRRLLRSLAPRRG